MHKSYLVQTQTPCPDFAPFKSVYRKRGAPSHRPRSGRARMFRSGGGLTGLWAAAFRRAMSACFCRACVSFSALFFKTSSCRCNAAICALMSPCAVGCSSALALADLPGARRALRCVLPTLRQHRLQQGVERRQARSPA